MAENNYGLDRLSIDELIAGQQKAENSGFYKGIPMGAYTEALEEKSGQSQPVSIKPAHLVNPPARRHGSFHPIDGSAGMRGIGRGRSNR